MFLLIKFLVLGVALSFPVTQDRPTTTGLPRFWCRRPILVLLQRVVQGAELDPPNRNGETR